MPEEDIRAVLSRIEGKVDKIIIGDGTPHSPGYAGELALLKRRLETVEGHWAKIWAIITIPVGALILMAVQVIYGHK